MEVEDGEAEEGELEEGEAAEEPKDVAMPDAKPEGMLLHIVKARCKSSLSRLQYHGEAPTFTWRCVCVT